MPYPLGWSEVQAQPVDIWLSQQSAEGAVAQFPLWKAEHGVALYAAKVHGKPIVYGYGAFFPHRYRQMRPVLWDSPTKQAIALLHDWGVKYVLVGARSYGVQWPDIQRRISQFDTLRLVAVFDEEPLYHSGWLAELLPDFGRAFIVDRIYVYELREPVSNYVSTAVPLTSHCPYGRMRHMAYACTNDTIRYSGIENIQ